MGGFRPLLPLLRAMEKTHLKKLVAYELGIDLAICVF